MIDDDDRGMLESVIDLFAELIDWRSAGLWTAMALTLLLLAAFVMVVVGFVVSHEGGPGRSTAEAELDSVVVLGCGHTQCTILHGDSFFCSCYAGRSGDPVATCSSDRATPCVLWTPAAEAPPR